MTGRHATGPWIRVSTEAALEQLQGSLLGWVDGIREYFTPPPPAAAPATAIAGTFPRAAGSVDELLGAAPSTPSAAASPILAAAHPGFWIDPALWIPAIAIRGRLPRRSRATCHINAGS